MPQPEKLQESGHDLGKARSHLESLGWIVNIQKSNFNPAQQVQFLGYQINSVEQRIFLPEEKKKNQGSECSNYSTNESADVGQKGYVSLGNFNLDCASHPMGKTTFQATPEVPSKSIEPQDRDPRSPPESREHFGGGKISW